MTTAARARTFSPVVHAVDDAGAVCGARPTAGKWHLSRRLPVTCPSCLLALSRPRYATCETPTMGTSAIHVREVGREGIRRGGKAVRAVTLCGAPAGWDVGPLGDGDLELRRICLPCKLKYEQL